MTNFTTVLSIGGAVIGAGIGAVFLNRDYPSAIPGAGQGAMAGGAAGLVAGAILDEGVDLARSGIRITKAIVRNPTDFFKTVCIASIAFAINMSVKMRNELETPNMDQLDAALMKA